MSAFSGIAPKGWSITATCDLCGHTFGSKPCRSLRVAGRRRGGVSTPTELAITLAALPGRYDLRDGWTSADQVAHRLALLGFECTAQQTAAWLARMARTDAPWVERKRAPWESGWLYRVTRFGTTDIDNHLESVRAVTPWLPTMRGAA